MTPIPPDLSAMPDALVAALLFAIDPHGFGGLVVRSRAGPDRDAYLAGLRSMLPAGTPWRRLPATVADERLDGGLDLAATLAAGKPVRVPGLLAETDGGIVVLPMAERVSQAGAARLGAALDSGRTAQDGRPARFGIVALDEGGEGEAIPASLAERSAFQVALATSDLDSAWPNVASGLVEARQLAPQVAVGEEVWHGIATLAASLGVGSLRPAIAAVHAARAAAALGGRLEVTPDDAGLAARLVLAPRATRLPEVPDPGPEVPETPTAEEPGSAAEGREREQVGGALDEVLRDAVRAALPPGLLLGLQAADRAGRQPPGRSGALQTTANRGRPAGTRRGLPRGGARLNLIETLRAAAPWQPLRRAAPSPAGGEGRIEIRRDDLRLTRFKQRTETVTLFAVDASGSLALQRLNEAKGAVELLLAECYVRRDQVALLTFRGTGPDLPLPPTRSLARAKRCLADLAGGGPTPLAAALDMAVDLTDGIRRRGRTPLLVLLTDGRGNVTRAGAVDRVRAQSEAEEAARAVAGRHMRSLLVDAAPRPQAAARVLAGAMDATYLPLPRTEAAGLARAVRGAAGG